MTPNLFSTRLFRGAILLITMAYLGNLNTPTCQELDELRVGHWIVVRGKLENDGRFSASQVNLEDPESEEALIGTVSAVAPDGTWLTILDQRVTLSDATKYRGLSRNSLLGKRIKVDGHYRGFDKFSSRTLSARSPGRERIAGRIDAIFRKDGKLVLELMRYQVELGPETKYVREKSLENYALSSADSGIEKAKKEEYEGLIVRVDEDYLAGSFRIAENVHVGLRTEYSRTTERDFDLDGARAADRIDDEFSLRAVGVWSPNEHFFVRLAGRLNRILRQDEADGRLSKSSASLTEAFAYWSRINGAPIDLQVGRQDYYDEREWLWDQNLDAFRVFYHPNNWIVELAAATTLADGSPREEETDRMILNVSRNWPDKMLGAYLIDQRGKLNGRDYPFFAGLRAYGEWFADQKSWAELSLVRGYQDQTDIRGWGFDLGSTWSPREAKPWYFSAGYAFGSGDDNSSDGVDHAFRQTGIQDNNDKLGGVTSFKYYGELFEPELSNLHILTLGVGRRFGRRFSLDLIYHNYEQDEAFNRIRDSSLDLRPNGTGSDLGHELDLVFGHRASNGLDTEVVLASFDPGNAFNDGRSAYLVKFQLRYKVR